jgi:hypothetical protein
MDPNLMAGMGDILKNPEMMKQAMEMMKNNPGLMEKMMGDIQPPPSNNLDDTEYDLDDRVTTCNLNNETYNNQEGLVKSYSIERSRFEVLILSLEKSIYVKPENLVKLVEPTTDSTGDRLEHAAETPPIDPGAIDDLD